MRCPKCGSETENGKFCKECGTKLESEKSTAEIPVGNSVDINNTENKEKMAGIYYAKPASMTSKNNKNNKKSTTSENDGFSKAFNATSKDSTSKEQNGSSSVKDRILKNVIGERILNKKAENESKKNKNKNNVKDETSKEGFACMILGILSVVLYITAIPSIIIGVKCLRKNKKNDKAIVGICCSALAIILLTGSLIYDSVEKKAIKQDIETANAYIQEEKYEELFDFLPNSKVKENDRISYQRKIIEGCMQNKQYDAAADYVKRSNISDGEKDSYNYNIAIGQEKYDQAAILVLNRLDSGDPQKLLSITDESYSKIDSIYDLLSEDIKKQIDDFKDKVKQAKEEEEKRIEAEKKAAEEAARKAKEEEEKKAKEEAEKQELAKKQAEAEAKKAEAEKAKAEAEAKKAEAEKAKAEAEKAKSDADRAKAEAEKAKSSEEKKAETKPYSR